MCKNMIKKQKDYRPDIDGLRAIAIISVIIYHINNKLLIGGFVGVDMFFVISGFLITSHILHQVYITKNFSFAKFYLKRIKRIVPALFVMILVVLFSGYLLFTENYFKLLGEQSFAAILSYSNIYFYLTSGYFDLDSSLKPLLHTWSLGVEEQFYLLWPILLVVFSYFASNKKYFIFFILVVFSLSYIINYIFSDNIHALFYLMPFRIFEFCIGALAAFFYIDINTYILKKNQLFINTISTFGFALIVYSLFKIDNKMIYPYYHAFPVILGTGILILLNNSMVSKILSQKILVNIGLISYSLYLYHWPIIVYFKYELIDLYQIDNLTAAVVFTLILAVLSYHFIEKPFRFMNNKIMSNMLVLLVIVVLILSVIVKESVVNSFYKGKQLFSDDNKSRFLLLNDNGCDITNINKETACNWKAKQQILFFGNSHNLDAYNMFRTQLDNTNDYNLIYGGDTYPCQYEYLIDEEKIVSKNDTCTDGAKKLLDKIFLSNIDTLVVHFFKLDIWGAGYMPIVEKMKILNPNIKVIVVGSYIGLRPNNCAELINKHNDISACIYDKYVTTFPNNEDEWIKKQNFSKSDFLYIDTVKLLCGNSKELKNCTTTVGNGLLFYDGDHFSFDGAELVGSLIFKNYSDELKKYNLINNKQTKKDL